MSTITGRQAEDVAAEFLRKNGFKILFQNWRTRWCEIDIVAQKHSTIYFVEVKYRRSNHFGDGLEYLTPTKLKQMNFAAEFWIAKNGKSSYDYRLSAMALSGQPIKIDIWLDKL